MEKANSTESNQNNKNHNKIKFCVRILQLLNETLLDNTKIKNIGLAWCEDGFHFICNSQILGNYINLKANSINTNFRAHSFQIENFNIVEIQKKFGNLPDIKNWKMRRNTSFEFTTESFEFEVGKIPCLEKNKRAIDANSPGSNSVFPSITIDLLKNNQHCFHQVEMIMEKADFMPNWKNKFLRTVSKDWVNICQKCNVNQPPSFDSVNTPDLIQIIIDSSEPKIDQDTEIIEDNISYLLENSNGDSQSLSVLFIDFLKLCLRFGTLKQIANSILEISSQTTQSYASWFIPSTDLNYATESMDQNDNKWCIKPSKTYPNAFTLLVNFEYNKIQYSHIMFNPMPLKPEQSYFIKDEENSSTISRASLKTFLKEVVNLTIPQDKTSTSEKKMISHVSISTIANRNSENEDKTQEMPTLNCKFSDVELPDDFDSNDFLTGSPEMALSFSNSQQNQFSNLYLS